ncbi:RNA polymerase sigma factor [Ornithinimicrobium sp. F0845]|uniref:SigE family RNA polymerase sigma factor n=1 Tax=Ornithinimicrobium sp. F0845 TaxID=2926412 RepID=UPI001FF246AF|nr:RNA polymerase sigma factor [Ornithinimicrobium sp. F0845]
MRRAQEESFVEFATSVKPWLLTTAWMLTADRHAAEDLVQETLVRVYLKWPRIGGQQPTAYARRVLANLHTDRWRRTRREVLVDQPHDILTNSLDTEVVDVVRALQAIGPRERESVVLRHYLDLSEKQTAETMGVSVGAVKGYTSRGLAALRASLKEDDRV